MHTGTGANPFGVIDTPANNVSGVTGAIPVTGWALDDTEVAAVNICRAPVGARERAARIGRCGGAAQIYPRRSDVFVDGARPDVGVAFPTYPRNMRGGWGFMVLTNMLPAQGNGTYTLLRPCIDRELHSVAARLARDDLHQRAGHAALRRDRYAVAGRHRQRLELSELRLGADAAAEDDPGQRVDDLRAHRRRRGRHR